MLTLTFLFPQWDFPEIGFEISIADIAKYFLSIDMFVDSFPSSQKTYKYMIHKPKKSFSTLFPAFIGPRTLVFKWFYK